MKENITGKIRKLFYGYIDPGLSEYRESIEVDDKKEAKIQMRMFLKTFAEMAVVANIKLKMNDITNNFLQDEDPSLELMSLYAGVFTGYIGRPEKFATAKENLILAINEALAVAEEDEIAFNPEEKAEIFGIERTKADRLQELFGAITDASLAYLDFVPKGQLEEAKTQLYGILCAMGSIAETFEIQLNEKDILQAAMGDVELKETFKSSISSLEELSEKLPYVELYGRYGKRPVGDGRSSREVEEFDRLEGVEAHILNCITEVSTLANNNGLGFSNKEIGEVFGISKKKVAAKRALCGAVPTEERTEGRRGKEDQKD